MKNYIKILIGLSVILLLPFSCSDEFLEVSPPGSYSEPALQNAAGVEGMLIATYSALDGTWFESWDNNQFNQQGGASNWVWGGVRSEIAYKGSEPSDGVLLNDMERSEVLPSNGELNNKWGAIYDGIGKANATIRNIPLAADLTDEQAVRILAEARALRGHYHFEGVKVFGRVPYVDETVGIETPFAEVKNPAIGEALIWDQIEADFQYAYDNLSGTMPNPGRINKYAAGAFLAKVHIFQADWSAAEAILDDVINNGTTASGDALALMDNFHHNFRADFENENNESLFGYEASFGDGSISNGNYGWTLNQPHGPVPTNCCGFFQPSQNLANSYKVDADGLPLIDTFNDTDLITDEGLTAADAFTPDESLLDPRIDWTIGRRGIPYLDWGVNPGVGSDVSWVRQVTNGGPYNPVKTVPTIAEFDAQLAGVIDWGFTSQAKNVHIIRFSDVILMAAEVKAELGKLADATTLVNRVRERMSDSAGWVTDENGDLAANYSIGMYPTFASQTAALQAIRFERKIELAMEGHRFFDLVRWHLNSGSSALAFDMIAYMNTYYETESVKRPHLAGAVFNERDLYAPIPQTVIANGTVDGVQNITQNAGF
ncbi:RagB/SusD family nutrient uptake outer membrane protein [Chondrinema litorale]|uniref:RagB/SusD family nutrient uptake outer membrane protein n=1 Tax=Chondrinema litorale TaxID=2994555 RepID=UPI0025434AC4|nr:RagB/SusD family nutrient uptake outer membrane protein [Chondrinema litorale]UZR96517.1 RagB/SusD family nutrient uptake outer membrane protein [Chondrinema litorale]